MDEVRNFYVNLMGTAAESLPMVDRAVIAHGHTLLNHHQHQLCCEVTDQEVELALFNMNSEKAPGIDGYNAYFFKKGLAPADACLPSSSFLVFPTTLGNLLYTNLRV